MAKSVLHRKTDGAFQLTYWDPTGKQVSTTLRTRDEAEAREIENVIDEMLIQHERLRALEKEMDHESFSDLVAAMFDVWLGPKGEWTNPHEA